MEIYNSLIIDKTDENKIMAILKLKKKIVLIRNQFTYILVISCHYNFSVPGPFENVLCIRKKPSENYFIHEKENFVFCINSNHPKYFSKIQNFPVYMHFI